jgi:integrase
MTWSKKRGFHNCEQYQVLKKFGMENEITFMTLEEVMIFKDAELPERSSKVRDLFCLVCFTGLRYSDLSGIGADQIQGESLVLRTEKDEDRLEIPITAHIRDSLSRHPDGFPTISNQKGNDYLKEAAQLIGMDRKILVSAWDKGKRADHNKKLFEIISWHMARRTFITLSLELGMDPMVIIRITGHFDTKALRPYLAVTDKLKKEQMSQAWGSGTLRKVD